MGEPALVAEGLRLRAGGLEVRVGRLEAVRGEVLAVLGPNGSGKTTLLQGLAGLRALQAGRVQVRGTLAYLPQRPVLFSGTVLRNAALPLRLRGVGRREAEERARLALRVFRAEHLAHRSARGLSGGEARRVALARALVGAPGVLLLDEPFGGLDAPTRERLLAEAAGPLRGQGDGRATVLVTHDPEEALALADRVVVLVEGAVAQEGTVEEVFGRPASERVAEVVGSGNILFGRVVGEERGTLRVRVGEHVLEAEGEAAAGEEVVLTVRPEAIVLYPAPGAAGSARNRLPAVVRGLERRPHLVRVSLEAGSLRLVATVAPATVEEMGLVPGAAVVAGAKATSVHAVRRR